jgi:hypothetical protein
MLGYYTKLTNALHPTLYIPLLLIFSYCRYKHIVAELISLQITDCLQLSIVFPCASLNVHHIEKCLKLKSVILLRYPVTYFEFFTMRSYGTTEEVRFRLLKKTSWIERTDNFLCRPPTQNFFEIR